MDRSTSDRYEVTIAKTQHGHFSDFLLFFPLESWLRDTATFVEHTHRLFGVLVGLLLATLTGWSILDPALAAVVAANILWAGTKIMSWTRGAGAWSEAFDAAAHQLGAITRLAVSPKGDALAIVVAEPKR